MNKSNLRDHKFTSRMAACNFLLQAGLREESPDRWVGRQATAKIVADKDGVKVTMRRRHTDDRRY